MKIIKTFEERKEELLKLGKEKGVITFEQLAESLKGLDVDNDSLDELYNFFVENNIEIVSDEEDGSEGTKTLEKDEPIILDDAAITKDVNINDPVRMYLKEIGRISLLSAEQELDLSKKAATGDEMAKNILAESNLRLVVSIAKRYVGRGLLFLDLIQEGNIALMQVLKEITGKKMQKEPLRYIKEYVQYEMEQYIDEEAALGDEEERVVAKLGLLHEAAKYMAKENGELPSEEELAAFTKIPVQEIAELIRLSQDVNFVGESNAEK